MQKKDNSQMVLAVLLIAVGVIWLFRQVSHFPFFTHFPLQQLLIPFRQMFSFIDNTLFSWQMILVLTGIILLAGRRSSGFVLVVLGGIFLLPEILHFSFWSLTFLVPALLIGAGVILILKASLKIN